MRPVISRGKRKDGKGWVYGYYFFASRTQQHAIRCGSESGLLADKEFEIDFSTHGTFTGFVATKYKRPLDPRIFEGDLFRSEKIHPTDETKDAVSYSVVMWIRERGAYYLVDSSHWNVLNTNDCEADPEFEWLFEDATLFDFSIDVGLTKVGNIYDNPEFC